MTEHAIDNQLEAYFTPFRQNIIGVDHYIDTPYGVKKLLYADWTASGRLYRPIEELMCNEIAPLVANTHTETNFTGSTMTKAYAMARQIIKDHVNAIDTDILISSNSGMTGVVNKFQRILGMKIHEKWREQVHIPEEETPIVFCTHMEHHSNQTSWIETIADVAVIPACDEGLVNLDGFKELLEKYKNRKTKIAAVTSCSNVTGIITPYYEIAKMIHEAGGYCFVDFACSGPYIEIDMHPDAERYLDAIYFSPHKFLGGPGGSGILIFNQTLYKNKIPDNPGGGTVDWTNPWGDHKYHDAIEAREDGGTPSFLQTMRVALSIKLKEKMGVEKMQAREKELIEIIWTGLEKIEGLHIMADNVKDRLGIFSFYIDNLHYNLAVKLLNDRFGIQTRGGCSCAGTYGHYLLHVSEEDSQKITSEISSGILTHKPGWVRMSIHPTTTDEEAYFIVNAIKELVEKHTEWAKDYKYCNKTNDFAHVRDNRYEDKIVESWFADFPEV